jgi:hypothetical protein
MTSSELLMRIGEAAIRESKARIALDVSEGKGQREQARLDRTELSAASRALRARIAEAEV